MDCKPNHAEARHSKPGDLFAFDILHAFEYAAITDLFLVR